MAMSGRFETLDKRFWSKVEKKEGCWEWTAARLLNGYGVVALGKCMWLAHRASWLLHYGEIPQGMLVLHHCDNRGCVRPDHLFLGTNQDNVRDMLSKGRQIKAQPKLRGENHRDAKLTWKQVTEARRLHSQGRSIHSLARQYAVSKPAMSAIIRHRTWLTESTEPP
jgi:HNH endonuclease